MTELSKMKVHVRIVHDDPERLVAKAFVREPGLPGHPDEAWCASEICSACSLAEDHNTALQVLCRAFKNWDREGGEWDQWLDWYKPKQWISGPRALGAFLYRLLRASEARAAPRTDDIDLGSDL